MLISLQQLSEQPRRRGLCEQNQQKGECQEPREEELQEAEPAPDKESPKDSPGAVEDEPKAQQLQEPQEEAPHEEEPQEKKPDDLEEKE